MHRFRAVVMQLALVLAVPSAIHAQGQIPSRQANRPQGVEAFLVSCARPCTAMASTVARLGGRVTRRFDNLDAIVVAMPFRRLAELMAAAGPGAVKKDGRVARPRPRVVNLAAAAATANSSVVPAGGATASAAAPATPFNPLGGAGGLHAQGMRGQDVVIAVIDDGIAMDPLVAAIECQSARRMDNTDCRGIGRAAGSRRSLDWRRVFRASRG